jgi:hypothetical protein
MNEAEIGLMLARVLWKQFEFELPDTPARVVKVIFKELEKNNYKIVKGEANATDQQ